MEIRHVLLPLNVLMLGFMPSGIYFVLAGCDVCDSAETLSELSVF